MGEASVRVSGYVYVVTDAMGKTFTVSKDRQCSCGKPNCWHIRQVKEYLKNGGAKAPDKQSPSIDAESLMLACNPAGRTWTSIDARYGRTRPEPTPKNYYLKEFFQRAERLKALQRGYNEARETSVICDKAQYWFDLRSLSKTRMCDKWNMPLEIIDPMPEQLAMGI